MAEIPAASISMPPAFRVSVKPREAPFEKRQIVLQQTQARQAPGFEPGHRLSAVAIDAIRRAGAFESALHQAIDLELRDAHTASRLPLFPSPSLILVPSPPERGRGPG